MKDSKKDVLTSAGQLDDLRKEIDKCDRVLIEYFQQRMSLVKKVLQFKRDNKLPVFHHKREGEIIENALLNLKEDCFAEEVEGFLKAILKISRKMQSKQLFPYNIVLIGFMGTGKSTVGKVLSEKLTMNYLDTDSLIEEESQLSIDEIFEKHGVEFFRDLEKETIAKISDKENTIILCGGGVPLYNENIINLRKNGKVILLEAGADTIYQRIKDDTTRPLLKKQMKVEKIKEMLKQRKNVYHDNADIIIQTDNKTIDEISSQIITELYSMD